MIRTTPKTLWLDEKMEVHTHPVPPLCYGTTPLNVSRGEETSHLRNVIIGSGLNN
jgi:hypothetical protein